MNRKRICENAHAFRTREDVVDGRVGDFRAMLRTGESVGAGLQELSSALVAQNAMATQLVRRMRALETELMEFNDRHGAEMKSGTNSA